MKWRKVSKIPKGNGEKFPSFQNQVTPDGNGPKNKNKIERF
jgi:hypothetical protein